MKIDGVGRRLRVAEGRHLPPRVQAVIEAAAASHHITAEDLLGGRKFPAIVSARRHAAYRLRHEFSYSLTRIGIALGIHHTTVLNLLRNTEAPSVAAFNGSQPDLSGEWAI